MDLEENIILFLEELNDEEPTEFVLGEKYAYIECLEKILQSKGIDNETLLSLEKKYGIR